MQSINKSKVFISAILLIAIMFSSIPLYAGNNVIISNAAHKQTIEDFLAQIKSIQTDVSEIAQIAFNNPSFQETRQLKSRIYAINAVVEELYVVMQDYFATVPGVNERNRHILLAFNVLNLTKSNIYTLNVLLNASTEEEKFALSQEYAAALENSLATLTLLESILAKFS